MFFFSFFFFFLFSQKKYVEFAKLEKFGTIRLGIG